jgi:hypothetical protein
MSSAKIETFKLLNETREIEQIGQVMIVIVTIKTLRCVFLYKMAED